MTGSPLLIAALAYKLLLKVRKDYYGPVGSLEEKSQISSISFASRGNADADADADADAAEMSPLVDVQLDTESLLLEKDEHDNEELNTSS